MNTAAPGLLALLVLAAAPALAEGSALSRVLDDAAGLDPLETVLIRRGGDPLASRGYRGHAVDAPTNIKSASKAIVSALTGIAIGRGHLQGVEQRVDLLLEDLLPAQPDPRLQRITIGHLLSMQTGLARTSGRYYGRWIISDHWARAVLARPFVEEPGGDMLYSTGSSHLLSVILSRETGRSTLALARDWLGPLEDFRIDHWQRDPQGYYFGGNQMTMTPRSLLAFGELYRRDGLTAAGERLLPEGWVARSWQPRTRSRFTGDDYGYGWFMRTIAGHQVAYAWGFGGQMVYVVPGLAMTVVMTSDHTVPSGRTGHRDDLHRLLRDILRAVTPALQDRADGGPSGVRPLVEDAAAGVHFIEHPGASTPGRMRGRDS